MKSDDEKTARSPQDDERVDGWLRRRLEPTPEQALRVVHRAMAAGRSEPARRIQRWVPAAAFAATVVVAALALAWFLAGRPRAPEESANWEPGGAPVMTITNISGQVELQLQPAPEAGHSVHGVEVFSSGGLVAARVTNGAVRYLLVGGGT